MVRVNAEEAEAGGHLGFKLSSRPAWGSEPDLVGGGGKETSVTLVLMSGACPIVPDGVRAVPIHHRSPWDFGIQIPWV